MPRSASATWDEQTGTDEVDDYIRARRARRHRRVAEETGVDLLELDSEFSWETRGTEARASQTVVRAPAQRAPSPSRGDRRLASEVAAHREPRPPAAERPPQPPATGARRTVVITGRGAERAVPRRRSYSSSLRPYERAGFKPDRVAMWAVLLGIALLLVAVASAHGA